MLFFQELILVGMFIYLFRTQILILGKLSVCFCQRKWGAIELIWEEDDKLEPGK